MLFCVFCVCPGNGNKQGDFPCVQEKRQRVPFALSPLRPNKTAPVILSSSFLPRAKITKKTGKESDDDNESGKTQRRRAYTMGKERKNNTKTLWRRRGER